MDRSAPKSVSGYSAAYVRAPRLLGDLAVARGDGSYGRLLAKTDLLAIDDWLLHVSRDTISYEVRGRHLLRSHLG